MRFAITLTALSVAPTVLAVTLQDFKPRISGLPAACQLVYQTPLLGCSANDFKGNGCSDGCIAGMQAISPAVITFCSNANLPGNDVLSAYLAGTAVKNQCPNSPEPSTTRAIPSPTPSTTSTSPAPATSSTTDGGKTSSAAAAATTTTTTAATDSSTSSTSTTASGTTSAPSLATASPTSSAKAQSTPGNVSGGGSPFDTGSGAASLSTSTSAITIFLSALLAGYLL